MKNHNHAHYSASGLAACAGAILLTVLLAVPAYAASDLNSVIDSVRASANDLWHGFSAEDQELFVTSWARRWELVRHRMSPAMAELIS